MSSGVTGLAWGGRGRTCSRSAWSEPWRSTAPGSWTHSRHFLTVSSEVVMTRSVLPAAALSALAAAVVPLTAQAPAAPAASSVAVVIKAGRLVDARAGTILTNQAILVEGERIKEVGPGSAVAGHAPAGARVIDLSGATVLPGRIDCHTHITADPGDYYQQLFRQSPSDPAVRGHAFAKRTLEAGGPPDPELRGGEGLGGAPR